MNTPAPDEEVELEGLDVGLQWAYTPPSPAPSPSVLNSLSHRGGPSSPILLAADPTPAVSVTPAEPRLEGRYRLTGQVGRGGVGVVLRGEDVDLGREVAVKVLQDRHLGNPDAVRRFVEEAQIEGQLQHPGIVPIYEMGLTRDRRPFFSMKMIRGRTLANLLTDREAEGTPLRRLLQVFESVCQTVAYAHARGVVHRDLKPANIMVGAFGEVLVVDWGMGKVLRRAAGGAAPEVNPQEGGRPTSTVDSHTGVVLGTPRYMAPEQARGETGRVDERADVFALGGILCEILTGRPPFAAATGEEACLQAARGDVADALRRLDGCAAEPEFVALARQCLAPEVAARPRDAGEVAARAAGAFSAIDARAQRAETEATEARVKAAEERRRRRLAVALTATVAGAVLLAAGAWYSVDAGRRERSARVAALVDEAGREVARLHGEATATDPDRALGVAREALAVARRTAAAVETDAADAGTKARLRALVDGALATESVARLRVEAIARDEALRAEIDEVLARTLDARHAPLRTQDIPALWAEAFGRHLGGDVRTLPTEEAVARLRSSALRDDLMYALAHWRDHLPVEGEDRRRLTAVLQAADEDPWRGRFWRADPTSASYLALAAEVKPEERSPRDLLFLADRLLGVGDPERARPFAEAAWRRDPNDVWACWLGAMVHFQAKPRRVAEAAGFLQAGRTLRPGSALFAAALGILYREAVDVERAVPALEAAIRLQPNDSLLHIYLGEMLRDVGDDARALAAFREGMRLGDRDASTYDNVGVQLYRLGDLEAAIPVFREGLSLHPTDADLLNHLGVMLDAKGEPEAALPLLRKARESRPGDTTIPLNLANALAALGRVDEAVEAAREGIRLDPSRARAHAHLAVLLGRRGDATGATAAYREAVRLDPEDSWSWFNLGNHLRDTDHPEEAVQAFREAVRADPAHAEAHCNLGRLLHRMGRLVEAVEALRRGHEIGSARPNWPYRSAEWLDDAETMLAADRSLEGVLAGGARPTSSKELLALAAVAGMRGRFGESADLYASAAEAGELTSLHLHNAACSAALAGAGPRDETAPAGDDARRRWRGLAREWLGKHLVRLTEEASRTPERAAAALARWERNPAFAGVRDEAGLETLPEDERAAWVDLWRQVRDARATWESAGK